MFVIVEFGQNANQAVQWYFMSIDQLPKGALFERFPGQAAGDNTAEAVLLEQEQLLGHNLTDQLLNMPSVHAGYCQIQ